jgi:hypothetical protein
LEDGVTETKTVLRNSDGYTSRRLGRYGRGDGFLSAV